MTLYEVGRLCIKTAGREAGRLCVVLNKPENDLVLVTGPKVLSGVRRRNCNLDHLEPLPTKLSLKPGASDSDVLDLLKKDEDGLLKKLNLKVPTAEEIRKAEELRKEKKAEADKRQQEAAKKKEQEKAKEVKQEVKVEEKPKEVKVEKKEEKLADSKKPEVVPKKKEAKGK